MRVKIAYILLVFLVACSPSMSAPTQTKLPAATITPTVLPTTIPTEIVSSNQKIEIVERPLDQHGPWIFAYNEYRSNPSYFMNLDGTGYISRELLPYSTWYNYCPDSTNPTSSNGIKIFCVKNSNQHEFNIIDETNGTILRTIPLYGDQALRLIEEFIPPDPYFYPPFPQFILAVGRYNWSPDGKYIAFVGAMDGPSSDIYLYEPEHNSIRRLTYGPGEVHIIGWSPDSRNIVHASGEEYDVFHTLMANEVWIVDIEGNITLLYNLLAYGDISPIISDWIDEHTYISLKPTFEGNPIDLLLVNIVSKELTPIDAPNFRRVLFDSRNQRLLINWGPMRHSSNGVYEFDLDTGKLSDFATGLGIEEVLPLVPYYLAERDRIKILVDEHGEIVSELNCQQQEPESHDGNRILSRDSGSIILTDLETNTIRVFDNFLLAQWLPNSSGFYAYVGEYDLYEINTFKVYLYSEVHDWQPEYVNELSIYGCFTFVQP